MLSLARWTILLAFVSALILCIVFVTEIRGLLVTGISLLAIFTIVNVWVVPKRKPKI